MKSLNRIAILGATAVIGSLTVAQAATLDMWFNATGNTAHSPVIAATAGGTLNLTVYFQTTGVGAPSQIGGMLAWDNVVSGPGGGNGLSYAPATFAYNAAYAGNAFVDGLGNGAGSASNSDIRYGYHANTFSAGTMQSAEGITRAYYSLTLNVSLSAVGDHTAQIWVDPTNPAGQQPNSSYILDGQIPAVASKANSYSAIIRVSGVPEPATMAALGLGVFGLIRRRRSRS